MNKKGYKVTDVKREKKIGVAAGNLEELIQKSCNKLGFNVGCAECRLYLAEDGTRVADDDYFATLPPQTLFVLVKQREKMVTEFDHIFNLICSHNKEYLETGVKANNFLADNVKEVVKVFQRYISAATDAKTTLSERTQDPEWFEGLESSEKTKEQSMTKRAKERMRGYFYKIKTALKSSDIYVESEMVSKRGRSSKKFIDQFIADLQKLLESAKFNGDYFNRRAEGRLCLENGIFECGGLWNNATCSYGGEHIINPYRSREERILFQTWNMDHKIELSRSIIPKIKQAVEQLCNGNFECLCCANTIKPGGVEPNEYYLQIFTKENLKLVHIICHFKGKHDVESAVYTVCKDCYNANIQPNKNV